jgi:hypothetical protein
MARSDKRKEEEKNRRNFDDPLWIGSSGLVHVFSFIPLFKICYFDSNNPRHRARHQAKLYVCVFVEKRKITRKCLFRFFYFYFYAHSLIFSMSGPFGLFPFLVPFWMEHVDSFIFANSSFCALDGCSWRFLHLLDNSLFLFRIIKRVSATMMETFEKPTASFSFGFFYPSSGGNDLIVLSDV